MGRIYAFWTVYHQCLSLRIPAHFPPGLCCLWGNIFFLNGRYSSGNYNSPAFCRIPSLHILGIFHYPYGHCAGGARSHFSLQMESYLVISMAGILLAAGNCIFQFGIWLHFWSELYVHAQSSKSTIHYRLFRTMALVYICLWSIWVGILHFLLAAVSVIKET